MRAADGESRSSEFRQGFKNSEFESQSRSLGNVTRTGSKYGTNEIKTSGDDSNRGNTSSPEEWGSDGIDGKVIDQLVEELEDEVDYYKNQVDRIEGRINRLRKLSGELEKANNSD